MADPFVSCVDGDIEEQASPKSNSTPSITSNTGNPQTSPSTDEVKAATTTATSRHKTPPFAAANIVVGILCLATFPLIVLHVIISVCFAGRAIWPDEWFRSKHKSMSTKGLYDKLFKFKSGTYNYMSFKLVLTVRLGCLFFLWLVANLCVPSLKTASFSGSLMWKWSLLAVVILLGYPTTRIAYSGLFKIGGRMFQLDERLGILRLSFLYGECVVLILYYSWILVVWFVYFRTTEGLNPNYGGLDKYVTWSFVSLLVSAVLWMLKKMVLLRWEEKAIYRRFKNRILLAGFQLFFLFIIMNDSTIHCLLPWRYYFRGGFWGCQILETDYSHRNAKLLKRTGIQNYMLSTQVNFLELSSIVYCIKGLAHVTSREEDHIAQVVQQCEEKIRSNNVGEKYITSNFLVDKFVGLKDDVHLLLEEIGAQKSSDEVTFEDFRKWMVDAHKNCQSLGYTLIDAFSMVNVLNCIFTAGIILVVVLFWLLVTGLATTKVLVAIASPFLALTFIFGDTCKAFFQGVIFSFLSHPFDVGDRCVVDGVEVEIKRIGILTTTCTKIETEEKMLYPNSNLAAKLIINLGGKPDPTDVIELILDSSTTKHQIINLRKRIEAFLGEAAQLMSYERYLKVIVKEMGNNIKLRIKFKHLMTVDDLTHTRCFEKKGIQRSEFFLEIKEFLEDLKIKVGSP